MPILLMINMKGGVAKTTNTVAIAEALAEQRRQVLVIDADHQCMASELLVGEDEVLQSEGRRKTLHDLLRAMLRDEFEEGHIAPHIVEQVSNIGEGYPNLDLLPCSLRIDDFEVNMAKAKSGFTSREDFQRELRKKRRMLKRYLNREYDYVLVDCPPSLALQVREFLSIGDGFIVPCIPDRLSVRGVAWLLERMRRSNYTVIQPLGTLWSLYRSGAPIHKHIVAETERRRAPFDTLPRPFKTVVPNASRIAESTDPGFNPQTFSAKYTPPFARRYKELADEIRKRSARLLAL